MAPENPISTDWANAEIRREALAAAIKISPNNIGGESDAIVADARKFYDFLSGDKKRALDGLPDGVYHVYHAPNPSMPGF